MARGEAVPAEPNVERPGAGHDVPVPPEDAQGAPVPRTPQVIKIHRKAPRPPAPPSAPDPEEDK